MGQFNLWLPRKIGTPFKPKPDLILPNIVPLEGQDEFLRMLFRDDSNIAGGGNFYIGLCTNALTDYANVLTDITELTSAGGYAREAITRDLTGWPTLTTVNNRKLIRSLVVNFAATGADFSAAFVRMFLTDVASGTAGVLYAISGAFAPAILVENGLDINVQYEFFLPQ